MRLQAFAPAIVISLITGQLARADEAPRAFDADSELVSPVYQAPGITSGELAHRAATCMATGLSPVSAGAAPTIASNGGDGLVTVTHQFYFSINGNITQGRATAIFESKPSHFRLRQTKLQLAVMGSWNDVRMGAPLLSDAREQLTGLTQKLAECVQAQREDW